MALVKPIHIGRGVVPSYLRINGASHDYQQKIGLIVLALYMNRVSREENGMPVDFINIPISAEDWKDGLTKPELYALVKKDPRFADAFEENTPAPFKENFPEQAAAEIAGMSAEYAAAKEQAEIDAEAEKSKAIKKA